MCFFLLASSQSVTLSARTVGKGAFDVSSLVLGSVAESVGEFSLATSGLVAISGGWAATGVSSLELAVGVTAGSSCESSGAGIALFSDLNGSVTAKWGDGDGGGGGLSGRVRGGVGLRAGGGSSSREGLGVGP